jgi:periplasmic copper chaperone A
MRLPALLIVAAALAGCGSGSTRSAVTVDNAIVRLPAVPGRPAAGYATVAVTEDRGALVGISSPQAKRVEMHETRQWGGKTSMRHILAVQQMSHGDLVFEPGGLHMMLFDVDPGLRPGDRAALTFRFERGAPVTAPARVIGAGDDAAH